MFHPYWLLLMVLEGIMYATRGKGNHWCHFTKPCELQQFQTCIWLNSDTTVTGTTNHILIQVDLKLIPWDRSHIWNCWSGQEPETMQATGLREKLLLLFCWRCIVIQQLIMIYYYTHRSVPQITHIWEGSYCIIYKLIHKQSKGQCKESETSAQAILNGICSLSSSFWSTYIYKEEEAERL